MQKKIAIPIIVLAVLPLGFLLFILLIQSVLYSDSRSRVAELRTELSNIQDGNYSAYQERIEEIEAEIAMLESEMNHISSNSEHIAGLEEQIASLEIAREADSILINTLNETISALESELEASVDTLEPTPIPELTPAPTPTPTPRPIGSVSLSNFNRINTGMTYNEVVEIFGSRGTLFTEAEMFGIKTQIYTWEGSGLFAVASIYFTNGRVDAKSQVGLS